MTNDELSPNDETRSGAQVTARSFVIHASTFLRHSTFLLRHFPSFIGVHSCLLVVNYDIWRERDRGTVSQLDGNQGRIIAGQSRSGMERSHHHRLRRERMDL